MAVRSFSQKIAKRREGYLCPGSAFYRWLLQPSLEFPSVMSVRNTVRMNEGKIRQFDMPENIERNPVDDFVLSLIDSS